MLGNNFLPGGLDTACRLPKLPLPVVVTVLSFYKSRSSVSMSSLSYEATPVLSFYLGPERWQERWSFQLPRRYCERNYKPPFLIFTNFLKHS